MRRRAAATIGAAAVGSAFSAPSATADTPGLSGGSRAFGTNVAVLATTPGPVFGATASGVASSAPRAFPAVVVGREQQGGRRRAGAAGALSVDPTGATARRATGATRVRLVAFASATAPTGSPFAPSKHCRVGRAYRRRPRQRRGTS